MDGRGRTVDGRLRHRQEHGGHIGAHWHGRVVLHTTADRAATTPQPPPLPTPYPSYNQTTRSGPSGHSPGVAREWGSNPHPTTPPPPSTRAHPACRPGLETVGRGEGGRHSSPGAGQRERGPPNSSLGRYRFNDRQVWSCWSCCRRNLSAACSHYQQPCVKEPSVDNFREAMHGDAARTAALLLMIACSTDAPAAIRCPG